VSAIARAAKRGQCGVGGQVVGAGDFVLGERLQARSLACFVLDPVHAVGQLTGAAQRVRPLAAADDRE
jgi:hypothetical protein